MKRQKKQENIAAKVLRACCLCNNCCKSVGGANEKRQDSRGGGKIV